MSDMSTAAVSLNTIMDHLSSILGGGFNTLNRTNDAAELYALLAEEIETGKLFTIQPVSYFSDPVTTAFLDPGEVATSLRYSLLEGLPFIVFPPAGYSDGIFSNTQQNSTYHIDMYSEQFWADRAEMLQWKLEHNQADTDYLSILTPDYFDKNVNYTDLGIMDDGQPLRITVDGGETTADAYDQVKFGTNNGEEIDGWLADDHLYGMDGNDTLNGNAGQDHLEGNTGNDTLHGGSETDYLYGGTGNDHLHGDEGNDFLIGGEGSDTYYYVNNASQFDGHDQISDVDSGDRLNINGHLISKLTEFNSQGSSDKTYKDDYGNIYALINAKELNILR